MRNIELIPYESLDELSELYPGAAAHIMSVFPNYRGVIYKFLDLDEFGIYEMTEGSYKGVINFNSPEVKPINLDETIDFYELGYNILDAGLKNVIYSDGWIYVLPDLK